MGLTTQRFYIDTNVFIVLLETEGSSFERFVEKIAEEDASLFTSEITLAETLVRPLREGDNAMVSFYENLLTSGDLLTVVPIHRDILRDSAHLRSKFSNKLPDAIHIATALRAGCSTFISSDRRLNMPEALEQIGLDQLGEVEN